MQSPCETIKKRIIKRIESKCKKQLHPFEGENSPNTDFAGDIISLPDEGHWGGFCHFAIVGEETPRHPLYVNVDIGGFTIS